MVELVETTVNMRTSSLGSPIFFNYNYLMDFNAANINSTAAAGTSRTRPVSAHKVLTEGSSVPVRVTRGLGGGRYEGFVAGVKVSFSSERALKIGDTFSAIVSGRDGKIILTPQSQTGAILQNIDFQMNEMTSSRLASLLQSAGLSSDILSSSIFQMFTQTGLKLDSQMLSRIRSLALRFSGKEKSAAEILVMLAEKGLNADEDEIKELLLQLSGDLSWDDSEEKDQGNQSNQNQKKLINRINGAEGAWYIFPFELVQYEGGIISSDNAKSVLGSGNLRLLFDSGKILKLMNLDCRYNGKRYLFSLGYESGRCKNVRFNVSEGDYSNTGNYNQKDIADKLKKMFIAADMSGINISEAEISDIEGNASGLENFYTFGGVV